MPLAIGPSMFALATLAMMLGLTARAMKGLTMTNALNSANTVKTVACADFPGSACKWTDVGGTRTQETSETCYVCHGSGRISSEASAIGYAALRAEIARQVRGDICNSTDGAVIMSEDARRDAT